MLIVARGNPWSLALNMVVNSCFEFGGFTI